MNSPPKLFKTFWAFLTLYHNGYCHLVFYLNDTVDWDIVDLKTSNLQRLLVVLQWQHTVRMVLRLIIPPLPLTLIALK